jgi:hypothetical protein
MQLNGAKLKTPQGVIQMQITFTIKGVHVLDSFQTNVITLYHLVARKASLVAMVSYLIFVAIHGNDAW